MMPTTTPTPRVSARPCERPSSTSHCASRCPSVAPENAPDSTPISVMPICTVERNLLGSEASASARREPPTPFSTRPASLAGRDETIASSDIDNRPLTTIRTATIASSRYSTRWLSIRRLGNWSLYRHAIAGRQRMEVATGRRRVQHHALNVDCASLEERDHFLDHQIAGEISDRAQPDQHERQPDPQRRRFPRLQLFHAFS